jgi:UDP-N-acetyl-D-mannosaminuronic acid dehydrogenase
LAFKADIDDLRESPAASITKNIATNHPGRTLAVEPNISELPVKLKSNLTLTSLDEALAEADIIVLLVDHNEFKSVPCDKISGKIIDTRGIWK